MKSNILFFFLFLVTNSIFGQSKISKNQFIEDIGNLKTKLEIHHLGVYHYYGKEAFESEIKSIVSLLPDSINSIEAYQITAGLISKIKDLHTSVAPTKRKASKTALNFPLILRKFNDKVFIAYNLSSDTTLFRGTEILKVNNVAISDLLIRLQNLYGTDYDNQANTDYYALKSFAYYHKNLYGVKDSTTIQYKLLGDSVILSKKIANAKSSDLNLRLKIKYKNFLRSNFGYTVLDSVNKIAKLDITSFQHKYNKFDFLNLKFKKDLKKRFSGIKDQGVEHLIIDFRGNGGGFIGNVGRITKYVSFEPFKLIDSMIMRPQSLLKQYKFWTIFPPILTRILVKKDINGNFVQKQNKLKRLKPNKQNHYNHNLYVLMDGGSYSATTFTIGLWNDLNRATFIGTRPGGANWGSFAGSWYTYKLPNSKTRVRMPYYKIVHSQLNKRSKTFFVEPDYNVDNNFEDFIAKKDTQLKFTEAMIKQSKK